MNNNLPKIRTIDKVAKIGRSVLQFVIAIAIIYVTLKITAVLLMPIIFVLAVIGAKELLYRIFIGKKY